MSLLQVFAVYPSAFSFFHSFSEKEGEDEVEARGKGQVCFEMQSTVIYAKSDRTTQICEHFQHKGQCFAMFFSNARFFKLNLFIADSR